MRLTPEAYNSMRSERLEREARAPALGEAAPDFELERLTPDGRRSRSRFRLAEARGRPLGLVFGSYT